MQIQRQFQQCRTNLILYKKRADELNIKNTQLQDKIHALKIELEEIRQAYSGKVSRSMKEDRPKKRRRDTDMDDITEIFESMDFEQ